MHSLCVLSWPLVGVKMFRKQNTKINVNIDPREIMIEASFDIYALERTNYQNDEFSRESD